MGNLENLKKTQSKKEVSAKVAEVIWMSIGGLVLLCGVVCLVWSIVINNIGTDTTNMYNSPLFFLVEWQDAFITWLNGWSKLEVKSVSQMGLWLVLGSAIYLLIVLAASINSFILLSLHKSIQFSNSIFASSGVKS